MYCVEVHRITTFALNDLFLSHDVLETYTYIYIHFLIQLIQQKNRTIFGDFRVIKNVGAKKRGGIKMGKRGPYKYRLRRSGPIKKWISKDILHH